MGDIEWLSNGVVEEVTGNVALGNSIVEWVTSSESVATSGNHKIGATELIIAKPA